MKTVCTILAENSAAISGIIGEHGFSVLIEGPKGRFLFDTGPGLSLPHNVAKTGVDLSRIDKIILSHGHYDHCGGLKWAVSASGGKSVVANRNIFIKHMAINSETPSYPPKYIGIPFNQNELEEAGAVFEFYDQTTEISDGVWFITNYPRSVEDVPKDKRLVLVEEGEVIPDNLTDDSCLMIEDDPAPILILGCTHGGIVNILLYLKNYFGIKKLKSVIGGTHLMVSDEDQINRAIDVLDSFSVGCIGVSHCTGFKASLMMALRFGEKFILASAGSIITL